LGRKAKAIRMFRYRMRTQRPRINQAVWELTLEGYTPAQIAATGYALWMAEFARLVHQLQVYAIANDLPPIEVVMT
jgi:hypothetical protein